jgi:hypothetical protein
MCPKCPGAVGVCPPRPECEFARHKPTLLRSFALRPLPQTRRRCRECARHPAQCGLRAPVHTYRQNPGRSMHLIVPPFFLVITSTLHHP